MKRGQPWKKECIIEAIIEEFEFMKFQGPGETWKNFEKKISKLGCIVEQYLEGVDNSPSVQVIL
jgi:hypothetical protein